MTGRFTFSPTCAFKTSLLWLYSDFSLSGSPFHQASGFLSLIVRLDWPFPNFSSALIDLLCVINMFSNLTQSVRVLLNGVIINLGSFAVVERASFSSFSRLCVACNYASIFSCLVRALLVASATQLNGSPLLAVVLVWLQIVFFPFPRLFPLVCYLRTSQAFLVHKKCGMPGFHVLLPLSHWSGRYTMIYF